MKIFKAGGLVLLLQSVTGWYRALHSRPRPGMLRPMIICDLLTANLAVSTNRPRGLDCPTTHRGRSPPAWTSVFEASQRHPQRGSWSSTRRGRGAQNPMQKGWRAPSTWSRPARSEQGINVGIKRPAGEQVARYGASFALRRPAKTTALPTPFKVGGARINGDLALANSSSTVLAYSKRS